MKITIGFLRKIDTCIVGIDWFRYFSASKGKKK